MVMETDILSRGMSLNKIFMSSTESMATPSGRMENKTGYNEFQGFGFQGCRKLNTVEN